MTKELTAKDIKKLSADELYAQDASHMLVACRRDDYSASRMARAVEDADAHVLNLNVTALHPEGAGPDMVLVALRVGRRDAAAVARSLARYGYETVDFDGRPTTIPLACAPPPCCATSRCSAPPHSPIKQT